MTAWPVQDAKVRFSELLDTTLKEGPQVVTRRGVEAAVLVPIKEWHRLQSSLRPGLKGLLLGPGPRFEELVPDRGGQRMRRRLDYASGRMKW
jgi:antitoxin Phd